MKLGVFEKYIWSDCIIKFNNKSPDFAIALFELWSRVARNIWKIELWRITDYSILSNICIKYI